jgi:Tfp pilus assembly protein PilV
MKLFSVRNERGDTIVEVLIAVAVVSLVLTSAYAVTNRNARAIQGSQEQAYAQKLLQQQVEYLRAAPALATGTGCYTGAAAYTTIGNCNKINGGATYKVKIVPGTTSILTAQWDTLAGSSAGITVYYRTQ